jgi:hypothetical protein
MTSSGAVKLTLVGLIIVAVRQRAWNTPVHEIDMRRKDYSQRSTNVHPSLLWAVDGAV